MIFDNIKQQDLLVKHSDKISIHKADMDQTNLLDNMKKFNDESR